MRRISGEEALRLARNNPVGKWNRTASSGERSTHVDDASRRIYDGPADIRIDYEGPKLIASDPVFAMGSCFAREIERALVRMGGNVVSTDDRLDRPEFKDEAGKVRTGFFNRFTPRSMWQELKWCFGELDGVEADALIFGDEPASADFNYWRLPGVDETRAATLVRRRIAQDLARTAAVARLVILTLGFTEAWYHKPSGLYANSAGARHLKRRQSEFELHHLDVADTVECLEEIHDLLARHGRRDAQIVVTVSPVPIQGTFTGKDIVIANMDSKATLRAAAAEFAPRHSNVHYFPSYEMVTYTAQSAAWRPDRIHVDHDLVDRIAQAFAAAYYELGVFDVGGRHALDAGVEADVE